MSIFDKESKYPSHSYKSINFVGKWQKKFIDEYVDSIFKIGIDKTHGLFSEAKEEHFPQFLYKFYTPSIHNLISIQNNTVHLSLPMSFNDPFDSYICVDDQLYIKHYILHAIEQRKMKSMECTPIHFSEDEYKILKYSPINGRYREELGYSDGFQSRLYHVCQNKNEDLRSKINSIYVEAMKDRDIKVNHIRNIPFRITCFSNFVDDSELSQNTTMWSHYAENHTGFCVKYLLDFDNIPNADIIKCGLFPVLYSSRVPKLTLQDFKKIKRTEKEIQLPYSVLKKAYKALITKSRFWSYEHEWRLIINEANEVQMSYNTIPFLNISAIYLGFRINPNIKKFFVKYAETNNIKIYISKQSEERFELDFFESSTKKLKDDEYYSKLSKYHQIEDENLRKRNVRLLDEIFPI